MNAYGVKPEQIIWSISLLQLLQLLNLRFCRKFKTLGTERKELNQDIQRHFSAVRLFTRQPEGGFLDWINSSMVSQLIAFFRMYIWMILSDSQIFFWLPWIYGEHMANWISPGAYFSSESADWSNISPPNQQTGRIFVKFGRCEISQTIRYNEQWPQISLTEIFAVVFPHVEILFRRSHHFSDIPILLPAVEFYMAIHQYLSTDDESI